MNNTDGRVLGMNNTKKERIMRAGKARKDVTKKKGSQAQLHKTGHIHAQPKLRNFKTNI